MFSSQSQSIESDSNSDAEPPVMKPALAIQIDAVTLNVDTNGNAHPHPPPIPPTEQNQPTAEIIGDELKRLNLDSSRPLSSRVRRVCILDVDRNWTIEAVHGHALKKNEDVDASTSTTASSSSGVEGKTESEPNIVIYPHDADVVVKRLLPECEVETVYLRPDARQSIAAIRRRKHTTDVFINLYDRADDCGVKIVEYMQNEGLAFTGAGPRFYDPTRMELKRLCRYNGISTPAFAVVSDVSHTSAVAGQIGFPLFVKPEHGYDSVGIDEKSLVHGVDDLHKRVTKVIEEFGSALVERYVDGREFSVLVVGGKGKGKGKIHCFPPVEYRFGRGRQPASAASGPTNHDLVISPSTSTSDGSDGSVSPSDTSVASDDLSLAPSTSATGPAFITFEDKWGASFENRWFLVNASAEADLVKNLMEMAQQLYEAFEGEGFARFDIRMDHHTKKLYVLDVNPNCSIFYHDSCTADTIVSLVDGWSKERFMQSLLDHALERQRQWHERHAYVVKYSDSHGFSLHAARDLQPGELIYTDEESPLRLVTRSYVDRNWSEKEKKTFDAYAWPIGEDVYAIWDEDSSKWRPINHSCDPNTWMCGLEVRARRFIAMGEELTLDYATFEPSHPAFECWCGSALCRKMIEPNEYRMEWFKQRYGGHVSPFIRALMRREEAETVKPISFPKEMISVDIGVAIQQAL